MITDKVKNIDSYIATFPDETQVLLKQLRATIGKAAPDAVELISYNMPAFRLHRILVYFAGHKNHIGFYPGASGIAAYKNEISEYKSAKGSVQFPLNRPLPLELITKIVKFRVNENLQKARKR
jgi:uncharacterized protein YdhG (YjbR/CyaY superfamily)